MKLKLHGAVTRAALLRFYVTLVMLSNVQMCFIQTYWDGLRRFIVYFMFYIQTFLTELLTELSELNNIDKTFSNGIIFNYKKLVSIL